ncbi:MAG: cell division protein FtsL [Deltaproteobacteria bacterium]|nr:cell division protein FtsL [Deltaproteobacteria bacterium]
MKLVRGMLREGTRRRLLGLMAVLLVVGTGASVAQVWTNLRAIELGYKISEATRRHGQLVETNRRLRIEIAVLKDPARIARLAGEELGLRPPEPEQIRRLRKPGGGGLPSPGRPSLSGRGTEHPTGGPLASRVP